ncbi:MAG: SGNH/GDSL hydrolase family protein [Bacteroidaceae bacterium]|nr:SGNH/GDSL hydrolase family protein [Bacteroidaceae bacterium]
MKKSILFYSLFTILYSLTSNVFGQTIKVHEGTNTTSYNTQLVDSITFDEVNLLPDGIPCTTTIEIDAHWCALGTSITYLNDYDKQGRFEKGYMDRTLDQLHFRKMTNQGVSGGCIKSAYDKVIKADYYTIEHGINDWGQFTPVGTFDDYLNKTNNGSFAYWYRMVIDRIFSVNPKAKVVLCTPRKAYNFSGYLPAHCMGDLNGIYLADYVNIIRQIAEYEGFPLADFYAECGGQRDLARMSMDSALHPNDEGYQMMANVLIPALRKVIVK